MYNRKAPLFFASPLIQVIIYFGDERGFTKTFQLATEPLHSKATG